MANTIANFGNNTSRVGQYNFDREIKPTSEAQKFGYKKYADIKSELSPIDTSSIANSTLKAEIEWYNSAVKDVLRRTDNATSMKEDPEALRQDTSFLYDLRNALEGDEEDFRDRFMGSNVGVRKQTGSALTGSSSEQSVLSSLL